MNDVGALEFTRQHAQPIPAERREELLATPGFGDVFSDHMVTVRWSAEVGWHDAQVTAYGTISTARLHWLAYGFPFFGMTVAGVIGVSINAALTATDEVRRRYEDSGLARLCNLTPSAATGSRGKWAAQALPFVFGALWVLAIAGAFSA